MTVHTQTGKELQCDKITSGGPPYCMFIHLTNISLSDAITVFNSPGELPIIGYPEFTETSMVYGRDNDVNVVLSIHEEESNA